MQTELDNDTFKRVVDIVNEVYETIGNSTDQDRMLVLTCLQLAYKLEKISGLLESLDKKLNDAKNIRYKN